MSEPYSDECLYCGSPAVLDDAWFCARRECWAAYERECRVEAWRETHRPLTHTKARNDTSKTGASVWGHAYGAMIRACGALKTWHTAKGGVV